MKARHLFAVMLAAALTAAAPAQAFVPFPFHWDPPSVAFSYNDGSFASSGLDLTSVRNHLTAATFTWNEPGCTVLSVLLSGTSSDSYELSRPIDGLNTIYWESDGNAWPEDSTVYGLTAWYYQTDSNGVQVGEEADIIFNGTPITDSDGNDLSWVIDTASSTGIDFETVALHEMGHAIGLDHNPGIYRSVMYPVLLGGQVKRTLNPDDVAAVCTIYANPFAQAGQSQECATDHDCATGTCAFDGTNHFCAARCGGDCDCPTGYTCHSTAVTGVSVCVTGTSTCTNPDAGTLTANGGNCTRSLECASNNCYHPDGGTAYCTAHCNSDCDCNASFSCDTAHSRCIRATGPTTCTRDAGTMSSDAGMDGGTHGDASRDDGAMAHSGCSVSRRAEPHSGSRPFGALLIAGLATAVAVRRRRR